MAEPGGGPASAGNSNKLPDLSAELAGRIKLLRRDIGNLLFHFTRGTGETIVRRHANGETRMPGTAGNVLDCILRDGGLRGTSTYIRSGDECVCFTEAPIHEFSTLFRLNELAASKDERPRYEPYGLAVNKEWFFSMGGRPALYDHPDSYDSLPAHLRYRFVSYEPTQGVDFTWEREWRANTGWLELDPSKTLVVVPTAWEAGEIVYGHADWEPDTEHTIGGPVPTWLAVSLDLFGVD